MSSSDLSEALLISYIALLGALTVRLTSSSLAEILRQFALALPLGCCYVVASAIGVAAISSAWNPIATLAVPFLPCLWVFFRCCGGRAARQVLQGGVVLVMYFLLVLVLRRWNLTILSYDSYYYLFIGGGFVTSASFFESAELLTSYPVFIVVLQGLCQFLGEDYSPSIGPLFVLCVLLYIVFCVLQQLRGRGAVNYLVTGILLAVTFGSLLSPYFIIHQIFYLNNHTAHGCMMFLVVMEICLLASTSDESRKERINLALLIFTLLGGIMFSRIEGLVVASFVMVLLAETKSLTGKQFFLGTGVLIGFQLLWTLLFFKAQLTTTVQLPKGTYINTLQMLVTMAPPLAICGAYLIPSLRKTTFMWPKCALLAVCGGVCFHALMSPTHYAETVTNTLYNLIFFVPWGTFWPIAALAVCCSFFMPRDRRASAVCFMLLVYPLILVALTAWRDPYRVGWGDSANRMMGHLIPFVVYLALFTTLDVIWARSSPRYSKK